MCWVSSDLVEHSSLHTLATREAESEMDLTRPRERIETRTWPFDHTEGIGCIGTNTAQQFNTSALRIRSNRICMADLFTHQAALVDMSFITTPYGAVNIALKSQPLTYLDWR